MNGKKVNISSSSFILLILVFQSGFGEAEGEAEPEYSEPEEAEPEESYDPSKPWQNNVSHFSTRLSLFES